MSLFLSRTNKTFHTSCYVTVGISMSSADFESAEVAKIVRNVEVFQEQEIVKVSIVLLGNDS